MTAVFGGTSLPMTRDEVKKRIDALERESRLDTGGGMGNPEGARYALEAAIDQLVKEAIDRLVEMRVNARIRQKDRRERIAVAAMQGLLAGERGGEPYLARLAIEQADVLIKALDESSTTAPDDAPPRR